MDIKIGTLTLGLCHLDDLQQMALPLVIQHQNEEAERRFRQALQGREKVLCHDHKNTLSSRAYMEFAHKHYH